MSGLEKRLGRLEERAGISEADAAKRRSYEEKRAKIIAELNAFEARLRRMSPAEREAWDNRPTRQAEIRELREAIRRRAGLE